MGDACGLPRLTIFRIVKKNQKPTVEQYESILQVIGPEKQEANHPADNLSLYQIAKDLGSIMEKINNIQREAHGDMEKLLDKIGRIEHDFMNHIGKHPDGEIPWDGEERRRQSGGEQPPPRKKKIRG